MELIFDDGRLKINEWNNIILFENAAQDNIMEIILKSDIQTMQKILEFHQCKFNIILDNNIIISAPQTALDYFINITYEQWSKIILLASYIGYGELVAILLLTGRIKFINK